MQCSAAPIIALTSSAFYPSFSNILEMFVSSSTLLAVTTRKSGFMKRPVHFLLSYTASQENVFSLVIYTETYVQLHNFAHTHSDFLMTFKFDIRYCAKVFFR